MKMLLLPRTFTYVLLLLSLIHLSACASSNTHPIVAADNVEISDPYEDINRSIFAFNTSVDKAVLTPVTYAYRTAVPDIARKGVHNVLENVKSPVYLANELLQGDLDGAGLVTKRFLVNTVAGFGGLLDLASWSGDTYLPEDFGQTLAVWGVKDGPYLVLPILGPSSSRDALGRLVDYGFDPLFWYGLNSDNNEWVGPTRTGLTILDTKDSLMDAMYDLERNSFDFYAAVRSIIYQRRIALINDYDVNQSSGSYAIPDYSDDDY